MWPSEITVVVEVELSQTPEPARAGKRSPATGWVELVATHGAEELLGVRVVTGTSVEPGGRGHPGAETF